MTSFVYILELEGGRFYVGITGDIMKRIGEHMRSRGAEWTKRYPFVRLHHAETFANKTKEQMEEIEDNFTLVVMAKRGIANTRGGKWINIRLLSTEIAEIMQKIKPLPNVCIGCGRPEHGKCTVLESKVDSKSSGEDVQSPVFGKELAKVKKEKASSLPAEACVKRAFNCSRCGYPGHRCNTCRVRISRDGKELGLNPVIECIRCGHGNHIQEECRARFHKDGHELVPVVARK